MRKTIEFLIFSPKKDISTECAWVCGGVPVTYATATTAQSLRGCLASAGTVSSVQLALNPLAGRIVYKRVSEWERELLYSVYNNNTGTMALHTDIGLGDFVLMDKIDMAQFVKNLKIRCV